MRRVLVLAYYFPPLGGVGAQRTVKFLKYLAAFGYEATVVTGPAETALDWAPYDVALERDVPKSAQVVRIGTSAPPRGPTAKRLGRVLGRSTAFETWWRREAVAAAREVRSEADLIYASMSPFSTALAAQDIASVARIPWVADLRDPWALDDWAVYPTGLHRRLDARRMRAALANAAAIVMNTREAARALLRSFPELEPSLVATIPNGWDRDDFAGPAPSRDDDAFRIVYTGYSHAAGGRRHRRLRAPWRLLGGSTPGIDVLARSHVPLEEALRRVRQPGRRIELHVAGPALLDAAGSLVVDHGYLPHGEAVALMRSADLLYLAMHGLPHGVRTATVPGKTYEYLAAGRPILAALPDGDARDLLAGLPNVRLCEPGDVDCLARGVAAARAGELAGAPPAELVERFERRELTRRLAEVFDRVLARQEAPATRREVAPRT